MNGKSFLGDIEVVQTFCRSIDWEFESFEVQ